MKITQKKFKDAQLFFIDGIFNYEAIREIESIFEKQKIVPEAIFIWI